MFHLPEIINIKVLLFYWERSREGLKKAIPSVEEKSAGLYPAFLNSLNLFR